MQEALGAPALAMGATFLAFGAAVREAGLPLPWALGASLLVYGMPGQLVLLQALSGAGGGPGAAALGAAAANARFLPMAVALAPLLGPGGARSWRRLLAVPFIAITPWAAAIRRLPAMRPSRRLGWFLGFGVASWAAAAGATTLGHLAAPMLPPALRAALLFANPLYFALLLAAEVPRPAARGAILAGVAAAPLALLLPPAWGLLGAGLCGGTLAWAVRRWRQSKAGGPGHG